MSCRTTKMGSLATTVISRCYEFTDAQTTSLYHALKKEYSNYTEAPEIAHEEVEVAIDELYSLIASNEHLYPDGSSLRERALSRVAAARSEIATASNANKYALTRIQNRATAAQTGLLLWIEAHLSARSNNPIGISAEGELKRLLKEYKLHKREIQNAEMAGTYSPYSVASSGSANLMIIPQDKATTYVTTIVGTGESCRQCGQFIGIPSHDCPLTQSPTDSIPPIQDSLSESVDTTVSSTYRGFVVAPQREEIDIRLEEIEFSIDDFQDLYDSAKQSLSNSDDPLLLESKSHGSVTAGLSAPGSGRSLGLELEIDFPHEDEYPFFDNRYILARRLYQNNVTLSPEVERWHYIGLDRPGGEFQQTSGNWICEFDRSVDPYEGERGLEIKSQVLFDDPDTWKNLDTILTSARQLGAEPTRRTGLHINMGAEDFSANNPNRHNRLLRLASHFDDTLVRLAHNPASGAKHRGRQYCGYAEIPPSGFSSVSEARARSNHYQAFNLGHLPAEGSRHNPYSRIEVRVWDGATTLGRVQNAANVSLAFAELSKYSIGLSDTGNIAGSTRERFGYNRLEGEQWTEATRPFRQFMGLYKAAGFKGEHHLQALVTMFAESRWPVRW